MSKQRVSLAILAILFVMLWSSGWSASHYLSAEADILSVLSARYLLIVMLLLMIVTALQQWQRLSRREFMLHLMIGALCHALYLGGSMSAFQLGVSVVVVTFVNSLQPLITMSISGVTTGDSIGGRHLKGLFLGLLSVLFVVSDNFFHTELSLLALALPFIAMMAMAAGLVLGRRLEIEGQQAGRSPRPLFLLLLVHSSGASLVIVPAAAITGEFNWQFSVGEWSAIVWLAVVVSIGSYGLLLVLLRYISAVSVSSLTYLVPPATMLQSYLLFGDAVSVVDIIALCIASIAVYLVLSSSDKEPEPPRPLFSSARVARSRLERVLRQSAPLKLEM